MTPDRAPRPPCPTVRFAPDFVRRLELLVVRLAAARERREGAGRSTLGGGGEEFVAYRPYRPGEDLRALDWNLLARLDRPYVRVQRREASEDWAILLDQSASMGAGPPGKLQRAAEVACALASLGLRRGARVLLIASGEGSRELELRTKSDLSRLVSFLEGLEAAGDSGLEELLGRRRVPSEVGRLFLLGDLCTGAPELLRAAQRQGRELFVAHLLAPLELAPPRDGSVEWTCPESGERIETRLDPRTASAYERGLESALENWSEFAARHGVRYLAAGSATPFEELVRELVEGA